MSETKTKREAGNLALRFERHSATQTQAVLQYQDGAEARKCVLGQVVKSSVDTPVGPVECWVYKPSPSLQRELGWDVEEIKRKTQGAVKTELNARLFVALIGTRTPPQREEAPQ